MKPVAIVIPWFGKDLKGGAEQLAWQVAHRLARRNHRVEVLTTCCRSFLDDWSVNHYKPGKLEENGLVIRRFKVDPRREDLFNAANSHLLSFERQRLLPGLDDFELGAGDIFVEENINSRTLLKFIRKKHKNYKALIFLPYLYGPILKGVEIAGDKAVLQPCLHDEAYAYLQQVDYIFRKSSKVLYNSLGEQRLAEKLYGPGIVTRGEFVGVGIEAGSSSSVSLPKTVGSFPIEPESYILCLGRRDPNKNTDFLVDAFKAYREQNPQTSLNLVLAGPGNRSYKGKAPYIHDLGLVSEPEKDALLSDCAALFHPSENESYSRVIMEAWFHDKPVVVALLAGKPHLEAAAVAVKQRAVPLMAPFAMGAGIAPEGFG
jgi:glycosyltransferase involved in cell wall biosynthesis